MPISIESGELFKCVSATVKTFVLHLDRRDYPDAPSHGGDEEDPRRLFILDALPSDLFHVFIKGGALRYTVRIGNGQEDVIETTYRDFIKEEINQHLENTSYRSTLQRKEQVANKNKVARQVKRKAKFQANAAAKAVERRERNKRKAAEQKKRNLERAAIWEKQRQEKAAEKEEQRKAEEEKERKRKSKPKETWDQKQAKKRKKREQEKARAEKRAADIAQQKEDRKRNRDKGARKRSREVEHQADNKQKRKKQ